MAFIHDSLHSLPLIATGRPCRQQDVVYLSNVINMTPAALQTIGEEEREYGDRVAGDNSTCCGGLMTLHGMTMLTEENIALDRTVYERLFLCESLMEIVLDAVAVMEVSRSFRGGRGTIHTHRAEWEGVVYRLEEVRRGADEVSEQLQEGSDEAAAMSGRIEGACEAVETMKGVLSEETDWRGLIEKFKAVAPPVLLGGRTERVRPFDMVDEECEEESSEKQ